MSDAQPHLCPSSRLEALIAAVADDGDTTEINTLIEEFPNDARLHFLRGSVLAGSRLYPAARAAIAHALMLAPDYRIARFQLGFLEFTSGEPLLAQKTWEPLFDSNSHDPLTLFARGLMLLVDDDIAGATTLLRQGMAVNEDNPPLNHDMANLIAALEENTESTEPTSETQMLLSQFGATVRH